jgi:hypothetical protein
MSMAAVPTAAARSDGARTVLSDDQDDSHLRRFLPGCFCY